MIGFNRAYKSVTLLVAYPENLLNTEIVKDTARVMFVLGGLNALGCFDGLRSSVEIAKKVQEMAKELGEPVKLKEKNNDNSA